MTAFDALWLPGLAAFFGGLCLGGWATALYYRHRTAADVERRVRAALTQEARDWRIRLGVVCTRCAPGHGFANLLRAIAEEGRTGD